MTYMKASVVTTHTSVTIPSPSRSARGMLRIGSRTSPAIFVTSHHPPKEKNAAIEGAGQCRPEWRRAEGAANGSKLCQAPSARANATHTSPPMSASFSTASVARTRARADANDVHGGKSDDGGYGDHPESDRAERHDESHVAGDPQASAAVIPGP